MKQITGAATTEGQILRVALERTISVCERLTKVSVSQVEKSVYCLTNVLDDRQQLSIIASTNLSGW